MRKTPEIAVFHTKDRITFRLSAKGSERFASKFHIYNEYIDLSAFDLRCVLRYLNDASMDNLVHQLKGKNSLGIFYKYAQNCLATEVTRDFAKYFAALDPTIDNFIMIARIGFSCQYARDFCQRAVDANPGGFTGRIAEIPRWALWQILGVKSSPDAPAV